MNTTPGGHTAVLEGSPPSSTLTSADTNTNQHTHNSRTYSRGPVNWTVKTPSHWPTPDVASVSLISGFSSLNCNYVETEIEHNHQQGFGCHKSPKLKETDGPMNSPTVVSTRSDPSSGTG